jgi:hypothetical protein
MPNVTYRYAPPSVSFGVGHDPTLDSIPEFLGSCKETTNA